MRYTIKPFFYLPITFLRRVVFGRDAHLKQYFWDKWGFLDKHMNDILSGAESILWIDVASGGEILQLVSFLRLLKKHHKGLKIVLSTASDDAYAYAEKLDTIDFVFNTPWDFAFVARRALRQVNPNLFISVEFTRIPKHFLTAQSLRVKTLLLSGLMSCRMQEHPTLERTYALNAYHFFDFIAAKENRDYEGFAALGIERSKIVRLGNMKFDTGFLDIKESQISTLRDVFALNPGQKIFLAASVFSPEEEIAIDAFRKAKAVIPNLRLIIVPRFTKYIPGIVDYLKHHDFSYILRTELPKRDNAEGLNDTVVIVDTFGELVKLYHLADYIFLSGSIYPVNKIGGGKNIVEPLASKKPIFFGPHMRYWQEITQPLMSIYQALEVRNADDLATGIIDLSRRPDIQNALRDKAIELLHQYTDVISDNVRFVETILYNGKVAA